MKKTFGTIFTILSLVFGACSGEGDDPVPKAPPGKAVLQAPLNNTECLDGNVLSTSQSEISFSWDAASNASSYTLIITNAQNNAKKEVNSNTTEAKANLERGFAYSWYVVSKNTSGQSSQSETWRFYNAGEAASNFAPFAAEAVYPKPGASINAGSIDLEWKGSDLDGDLVAYEVYLDIKTPPMEQIGTPSSSKYRVQVETANTYYWYVVSLDSKGNRSNSEVFAFKVN